MTKYIRYIFLIPVLCVLLIGCDTEDELIEERIEDNPETETEELTGESGDADFGTYVSVGNSITAGLMDAALYTRGQSNSFPNLLAARFALAGGGTFSQPDIDSDAGFNISYNDLSNAFSGPATYGKLVLDLSIPGPVPTTPGEVMNTISDDDKSSVNNLGVPGLRMIELAVNGYGQLNPFFTRFALDVSSTSVLEQALARQPTFMTFWLGSNDVLSWASGGGVGPDASEDPGVLDQETDALVSVESFQASIQGSLAAMFATYPDVQGVIGNIPNVTLLPYFQAVSWDAIEMDEATATATTTAYAGYNAALQGLTNAALANYGITPLTADEAAYRSISFEAGGNGVVVVDDALEDLEEEFDVLLAAGAITEAQRTALIPFEQARQLKSAEDETGLASFGLPAEILTLTSATVLGTLADPDNAASVIGVGVPLDDKYTLTVDEISTLLTRIIAFNTIIETQASAYENLYVFDAYTLFVDIAINGYTTDGFTYQPDFSPNGVFSVDGIHPNPAGHAIIANEIMKVIETSFGADLPAYDVTEFSTVITQ